MSYVRDTASFRFGPKIDRECTSKRRFDNEAEAGREARIIFNEGGPELHTYRCSWCHGLHFTRRVPEAS